MYEGLGQTVYLGPDILLRTNTYIISILGLNVALVNIFN